jgi:hypothetical protein
VAGNDWWNSYKAALSRKLREKVTESSGKMKRFRFGGGEVLKSLKEVEFPAMLAGRKVTMKCHVVNSSIPLLWSRAGMAKAGVMLDLPNDRAKILGNWVDLDLTGPGHFSLFILPVEWKELETCLLTLPDEKKEKQKVLLKLHRQFGHPRIEVLEALLKKVRADDEDVKEMLKKIYEKCETCKKFSKTPARPVVSLPPASEFNEVLTMDLKEINVGQYKYILHMIDAYTRLSVSIFLTNKRTETIINKFMQHWMAVGYGRPKKVWTDVGGEFNSDAMRQMGEAIGTTMETGAGYSAWMNSLNERNHRVIDRCFAKVMNDNPKMDPMVALGWAVSAKNAFPMFGGYSSFQLVFGKNPNLPNIMTDKLPALSEVTTSASVAEHIQALNAGRKAFTESLCDNKIRQALRHRVRAVEKHFAQGEAVYYRRDGDKAQWRGPARVIGKKGSVHFLEHQGELLRVHACRMISTGDAEEQMGKPETSEAQEKEQSKGENQEQTEKDDGLTIEKNRTEAGVPAAEERAVEEAPNVAPLGEGPAARAADVPEAQQGLAEPGAGPRPGGGPERRVSGTRAASRTRSAPYPKAGDQIQFKDGEQWKEAKVTGRGGKASSRSNYDYFNLKEGESQEHGVHLDKTEWRFDNAGKKPMEEAAESEEEGANYAMIPRKEQGSLECVEAKEKELQAFMDFKVYEEVKDEGQERLSSRWIMTDKSDEQTKKVKARLVCRGYEETVKVQSDSPTGSRETLHMLLSIAASKGWQIQSGDVKNAYLQGEELEREVFMEPPREAKKPNIIWKLKKAVYGMNDAGRRWFFKVEGALVSMGCNQSKLDHCLFNYKDSEGNVAGILLVWVDDIFHAGTKEFDEKVVKKFSSQFMIGRTEAESFSYIGLAIKTCKEGITLDQNKYIADNMEQADLKGGINSRPLDKEEKTLLRRLTGQINWAATQSRPDMAYTIVELSTKFKNPILEDLKKANKAIAKLKAKPLEILYPKISGNIKMVVYSDAGFRNLPDQISSGRGHIIFMAGDDGAAAAIGWNSNKVKRVVGSTIAAEALSLQMALGHSFYLRAILKEILGANGENIPIKAYIDSMNLYEAVFSTKMVEDKKLRCDIAQIQEYVDKEKVELVWTKSEDMLADGLTKRGASTDSLLQVLKTGKLKEEGGEKAE